MNTTPSGGTAVMARRVEPHDSLDFFPTPLWATRALCEHVAPIAGYAVWEPACGEGAMHRALSEYADVSYPSDVHDYGWGHDVRDFLWPDDAVMPVDWIVTNPPFRLAEQFAYCGLKRARQGVALLVRSVFTEGQGRYERLFSVRPPDVIAQFAERVPMVKGRLEQSASTATAYCWMIWRAQRPYPHTRFEWIPPCRSKLERPGDWPVLSRETPQTAPDAPFPTA